MTPHRHATEVGQHFLGNLTSTINFKSQLIVVVRILFRGIPTMADPLSITASVIAVTTLAYTSSKMLYQTISGIQDAPEALAHLKTDVETLCDTIHSLQQGFEGKDADAALSESQKSNLREIKPTLEACHNACNAFKAKVDKLTHRSTEGHVSWRDRLKIQFQEKEVTAFQARLGSYKSTLAIAVEFATL
jgi:ABC-type transport system involved in cytochrome bd biosynthesis fused ATPase/permease subunit